MGIEISFELCLDGSPDTPFFDPLDNATTGARVHTSAAQTLANNTATKIALDTVSAGNDPDGLVDTVNGRIVFDRTGSWQIVGGSDMPPVLTATSAKAASTATAPLPEEFLTAFERESPARHACLVVGFRLPDRGL